MKKKNGKYGKFIQWISRLSVKRKLIFYGYVTISPILFLICLVLFFQNYSKTVSEKLANDIAAVDSLAEGLNMLQTEVKDISTYICINDEIQDLLAADNPEKINQNAKLWQENTPMKMVQDIVSLKGYARTIAVYPANGVRPYLRGMDASVHVSDYETVCNSALLKETSEIDNGILWKVVRKGTGDIYETNRADKLVLCREIRDLTGKNKLGYIVIGIDQKRICDMSSNIILNEDESVLILDRNGGELCRVGTLEEDVEDYLTSSEFVGLNYRTRKSHFTYGEYEVICNQMNNSAGIVCKIVPAYHRQMRIWDVVHMPVILLISMLIGLLPLLIVISNIVTRPLQNLSTAIEKFSKGDFTQQVEVTTDDEIGEVAKCFNQMVDNIRTLIDENYVITIREKESELAALQAQINPHFLYNTLDSLYWQAMEADNEEIAESILALSQLFQLVLNHGKEEVTVGQEIELVSRYLQLQKMRFEKRLNYELVVEDDIKRAKLPKLVLQPFVENAIVHGFENASVPCKLTVIGKREGAYIRFEVRDTGIGMRQDQIDAIWEQEQEQYSKQRIGRYAIKNIRERLQLRYKDNFELQIISQVGHGTTVIMKIPFEEGEWIGNEIVDSR